VMLYLAKTFWPTKLALLYPYAAPSGATVVVAVAVLVAVSIAVWLARKVNRCWLMGWLWFLGTLVPVIGLVQVGASPMADRYMYIPSIGIFAAVAFGLYELAWGKKLFPFVTALSLVACAMVTERQLTFWLNSKTLFRHTVKVTQNNDAAYIDLGQALDTEGNHVGALGYYEHALEIDPANYHVQSATGDVWMNLGKPAEALDAYQAGIQLAPDVSSLHTAAGRALAAETNDAAALAEFAKAEQLDANDAAPHLETAKILFAQGHDAQASEELHNAVRTQPDDFHTLATVARYLAANANNTERDPQGALLLAVKANDLSGSREPEVFDVLGMAFAASGDFTNAVLCASNALQAAHARQATNLGGLEQRLQLYQSGKPWLESFGGTNEAAK
jgi:protein O-mannosyl-transferase